MKTTRRAAHLLAGSIMTAVAIIAGAGAASAGQLADGHTMAAYDASRPNIATLTHGAQPQTSDGLDPGCTNFVELDCGKVTIQTEIVSMDLR